MHYNTVVQLPVVSIVPWKTRELKWQIEHVVRGKNNELALPLSEYRTELEDK